MSFEADLQSGNIILMHLLTILFQCVPDILRNETPINVCFAQGRGFFGTETTEVVGEGD